MQEETDNDVEMNGASHNGSHSGPGETTVDPGIKDDSVLEMGTFICLHSQAYLFKLMLVTW